MPGVSLHLDALLSVAQDLVEDTNLVRTPLAVPKAFYLQLVFCLEGRTSVCEILLGSNGHKVVCMDHDGDVLA